MLLNGKPSFCINEVSERDFIDNEPVKSDFILDKSGLLCKA